MKESNVLPGPEAALTFAKVLQQRARGDASHWWLDGVN